MVKTKLLVLTVVATAFAPAIAAAQRSSPPGNGQYNGQGYWTSTSGQALGQPDQSCQDINGGNTGPSYPGHTSTAPGSAFNETDGRAGGMYAGSQPQNSRNSASVSQYDVACANQPL